MISTIYIHIYDRVSYEVYLFHQVHKWLSSDVVDLTFPESKGLK